VKEDKHEKEIKFLFPRSEKSSAAEAGGRNILLNGRKRTFNVGKRQNEWVPGGSNRGGGLLEMARREIKRGGKKKGMKFCQRSDVEK